MAASTRNQALNAIVFLYREVVKKDVGDFSDFPRARRAATEAGIATRITPHMLRQRGHVMLSPGGKQDSVMRERSTDL